MRKPWGNITVSEGQIDFLTLNHNSLEKEVIPFEFTKTQKGLKQISVDYSEESEKKKDGVMARVKNRSPYMEQFFQWTHGSFFGVGNKGGTGEELTVDISGEGMTVLREEFGYRDSQIIHKIKKLKLKGTRVDIARDFHEEEVWDELVRLVEGNFFACRSKNIKVIRNTLTGAVETIYIGSLENREKLICFYDKRAQYLKKGWKLDDPTKPWFRMEARLYSGSSEWCDRFLQSVAGVSTVDHEGTKDEEVVILRPLRPDDFSNDYELPPREKKDEVDEYWKARDRELQELAWREVSRFFRLVDEESLKGKVYNRQNMTWEEMVFDRKLKKMVWKRVRNKQRWKTHPLWEALTTKVNRKKVIPNRTEDVKRFDTFADSFDTQVSKRLQKRIVCMMSGPQRDMFYGLEAWEDRLRYLVKFVQENALKVIFRLCSSGAEKWSDSDRQHLEQWLIPTMPKGESLEGLNLPIFKSEAVE